jgi:hypothetical protein
VFDIYQIKFTVQAMTLKKLFEKDEPEVFVIERRDLQIVVLLFRLDPDFTLTLRIDEQRKTLSFGHDGRVLQRQLVVRQTLQGPLGRLDGVDKHVNDVQRVGVGDVPVLEQTFPVLQKRLTEFLIERTGIGKESKKHENCHKI